MTMPTDLALVVLAALVVGSLCLSQLLPTKLSDWLDRHDTE